MFQRETCFQGHVIKLLENTVLHDRGPFNGGTSETQKVPGRTQINYFTKWLPVIGGLCMQWLSETGFSVMCTESV